MVKARGSTPLYNMCMMSFLLCVLLVSSVNKKRSTYFSTPFRDSVGIICDSAGIIFITIAFWCNWIYVNVLYRFLKPLLCYKFYSGNTPVTHFVHDPTRIFSMYSIEDDFNLFKELHYHTYISKCLRNKVHQEIKNLAQHLLHLNNGTKIVVFLE